MKPSEKSEGIVKLLDTVAVHAFGRSRTESIEGDVCVFCGKPIVEFRDRLSEKEYTISGLCQECQDKTFGHEEEEDTTTDIVCVRCRDWIKCDPTKVGLPDYWHELALAWPGESIDYTSPYGAEYTAADIGSAAEDRPQVIICPKCAKELWPWI